MRSCVGLSRVKRDFKMTQLKLATSLFMSTLLLSSTATAHRSHKDETTSLIYNWTGLYAGLNAGIVKNTMNVTDNDATTFNATIQQVSNPKFTGGLQVGYRRQLDLTRVSGVYGLEFSTNFAAAKFHKLYGSPYATYQLDSVNELKNLYLLQAIGGIAANRTFLFLAAGLAETTIAGNVTNIDGAPFFNSFSVGKKALGTAVGGGVEYAPCKQFSARLKVDVITPNAYNTTSDTDNIFQVSNNIVEATFGINYTFR